jgi:hypothetical protein
MYALLLQQLQVAAQQGYVGCLLLKPWPGKIPSLSAPRAYHQLHHACIKAFVCQHHEI